MPSPNINSSGFNSSGELNVLDAALLASFALNVRNSDRMKASGARTNEHFKEINDNLTRMNSNLEKIIELLEKNLDKT